MKKLTFCFFAFLLTVHITASGQQTGLGLIVRSDDMGSFHAANEACINAYRNGIETTVEVMAVTPWFPEAVQMLRENPGIDVGIHLTITSEWDRIKWRPLTQCPSLTDENGYFFPMMSPNPDYPGRSVMENQWKLSEIEQEFRAQIELGLKNIPQISHITGHMGSLRFDEEVMEMVVRLSEEYNLFFVEGDDLRDRYNVESVGYVGPSRTSSEKESAFIQMLYQLKPGKNYLFLDHPAYDNDEMKTVGHIGYEGVALDRQGVTDLLISPKVKQVIEEKKIGLINYNDLTKALPRSTPKAEQISQKEIENYLNAVKKSNQDLHSLMVLRHGKVVAEYWFGDNTPDKLHALYSVSKTYTATAIGFAVNEGRLKVTDKVISFFPDKLPEDVSPYLKNMEIRHLLTMSVGNSDAALFNQVRNEPNADWVKTFLSVSLEEEPGTEFSYNSMAAYMLSAIIQKVTGVKLIDYLYPRLFRPLGIVGVTWDESPQGINTGGWGFNVKTEDMAKLGQFILQKGKWNGKQLLPESWFDEATSVQIASLPAGTRKEDVKMKPEDSDWLQGYGYQMWRCRHNAYRADGANGQFIVILPEKDAVIVTTANIQDMQAELNLIWKYLLPALK